MANPLDALNPGPYTVPNPTPVPDPTVIDPVTGAPLPSSWPPVLNMPPMGQLNYFYPMPGPTNPTPKPAAPVPTYPTIEIEVVKKAGRPDRYYVKALPDTIFAPKTDAHPCGGIDDKGRLCFQFHNASDVVYIPRTEPHVWDRLYGVVEFSLHGADVEEPEDLEKKWGPSVPYDVKGPGYVHDD